MTRMNYPIHQPGTQGRKIFGYEIFVDNDVLAQLQSEGDWFEKVKKVGKVESIKFNLDLNIPDLNGRNIQVLLETNSRYMIRKCSENIKAARLYSLIFIKFLKKFEGSIFLLLFLSPRVWCPCSSEPRDTRSTKS